MYRNYCKQQEICCLLCLWWLDNWWGHRAWQSMSEVNWGMSFWTGRTVKSWDRWWGGESPSWRTAISCRNKLSCKQSAELSWILGAGWLCFLKRMNFLARKSFLVPVEIRGVCECSCLKSGVASWRFYVKIHWSGWEYHRTPALTGKFRVLQLFFFNNFLIGMPGISGCSFLAFSSLMKLRNLFNYVYTSKLDVPVSVLWPWRQVTQGSRCHYLDLLSSDIKLLHPSWQLGTVPGSGLLLFRYHLQDHHLAWPKTVP